MSSQHLASPPGRTIVAFARDVVETMALDCALHALRQLDATADSAREYRGTVEVVFKGYAEDPREIHQIPEVRQFMRALTERWPFWLYFCSKTSDSLLVVLLSLLDNTEVAREEGTVSFLIDPDDLQRLLLRLLTATNDLYDRLQLDELDNARLTDEVVEYLASSA